MFNIFLWIPWNNIINRKICIYLFYSLKSQYITKFSLFKLKISIHHYLICMSMPQDHEDYVHALFIQKIQKYFVSDISYNPNNLVFKLLKMWKDEKKSVVVVPLIISQNLKSLTCVWVYVACCIITPTHTNSSKIVKISHTKMLLLFIRYHHAFLFNDRNKKIGECV